MLKKLLNYKNIPIEARAALWFTFCTVLQKGILFITSPVFTRLMSSSEYGEYCIFTSWLHVMSIVLTLNLQAGVFNNAMHKYNENRSRYISSMHGLSFLTLLIFLVIYLANIDFWNNQVFSVKAIVIILIFVYCLFIPGYNFWIGRNRFEYKYIPMVAVTLSASVLSLLGGVIGTFFVPDQEKAEYAFLGYVMVYSGIGLATMLINISKSRTLFDKKYWKYALKFNLPLLPHYLSMVVLGQSDRIMIGRMCSNSEAGMYSFVYNIASALNVVITSVNQAIVPWQYKKMDSRDYKSISKVWNAVLVLLGIVMLFITAIAPDVIKILGTDEYMQAVWVVPPVILGIYFTALYNMFGVCEFYFEANIFIMIASVLGAVLNIFLNFIFIPVYGYMVAAYTTLVCYIIYAIAHSLFSCIITKKNFGVLSVYDLKGTTLISIIVIVLTYLIMITYNSTLLRYAFAIVLFVGSVFIGKIMLQKWQKIKSDR